MNVWVERMPCSRLVRKHLCDRVVFKQRPGNSKVSRGIVVTVM